MSESVQLTRIETLQGEMCKNVKAMKDDQRRLFQRQDELNYRQTVTEGVDKLQDEKISQAHKRISRLPSSQRILATWAAVVVGLVTLINLAFRYWDLPKGTP